MDKEKKYKKILEDYSFEVFWKDQLTAQVSVEGSRVHVVRHIRHPLRQLFAADEMTRNQLNKILELRCWDRGRPDIYGDSGAAGIKGI